MSQKEQIINRIQAIQHFKVLVLFVCLLVFGFGVWEFCGVGNKTLGCLISGTSVFDYLILTLLMNFVIKKLRLKLENKNG